jgi:transcription elongation factor GreA
MYNELTKIDIKKMQEEIDHRIKFERPKISELIIEAKAHGDLSENGEYRAARSEKGKNEGRIQYLRDMIRTAKIISTNPNKSEVGLFDKVGVYFENEDSTEIIRLSTTMRQDTSNGTFSKESPLGKAIIGHKIGDRILIQVNLTNSYYIVIKSIEKGEDDNSISIT